MAGYSRRIVGELLKIMQRKAGEIMTNEEIQVIRAIMREELQPVHEKIGAMDSKVGSLESKMSSLESKMDEEFSNMHNRMDSLETNMNDEFLTVNKKLDNLLKSGIGLKKQKHSGFRVVFFS